MCDHSILSILTKQQVHLVSLSLEISNYPKLGTMLILDEMGIRLLPT